MERIAEHHGLNTLDHVLRQLEARLPRVPELADHRPLVADRRAGVKTAREAWDEAREARLAASAELLYLDEEVDRALIDAGQTLYLQVGRDRNAPAYRKLFPVSPTQMGADLGSDRQDRWVTGVIDDVRTDGAYAALRPMADALAGHLDRLRAARARREELYVKEAQARAALLTVADDARRFYNGLYHRFMTALPDRPRLVESLFPKLTATADPAPAPEADPVA